jgi:hypothetical protein
MRTLIALLTPLALAACASFASLPGPLTLSAQDVTPAASAILDIIRHRLPPERGTLRLDSPQDELGQAIGSQVTNALRAQGFAIEEATRAAHQIGFAITPLRAGALLTVTIDGGTAAALLSRNAGGTLVPASGLSFREALP